mmetsp:Transcript_13599/g.33032  ORF Transcript_13599/g.33032 Transcript_13599/m.33032 type:complete len:386 (-) Transcript_13599:721-1878(-)
MPITLHLSPFGWSGSPALPRGREEVPPSVGGLDNVLVRFDPQLELPLDFLDEHLLRRLSRHMEGALEVDVSHDGPDGHVLPVEEHSLAHGRALQPRDVRVGARLHAQQPGDHRVAQRPEGVSPAAVERAVQVLARRHLGFVSRSGEGSAARQGALTPELPLGRVVGARQPWLGALAREVDHERERLPRLRLRERLQRVERQSRVVLRQTPHPVDSVAAIDERLGVEHLRERREPPLRHVLQLREESRGVEKRPRRLERGVELAGEVAHAVGRGALLVHLVQQLRVVCLRHLQVLGDLVRHAEVEPELARHRRDLGVLGVPGRERHRLAAAREEHPAAVLRVLDVEVERRRIEHGHRELHLPLHQGLQRGRDRLHHSKVAEGRREY